MKFKSMAVLAVLATCMLAATPAWSFRWGGYNSFGNGYGNNYNYGGGMNALRYLMPVNSYGGGYGNGYSNGYGGYGNGYNNNGFNMNRGCGHHHHHRRFW